MLLPSRGRWHLVDPWSPFAQNPPFAVIEMDLTGMTGAAFYYFQSSQLNKVTKITASRFGALYQMRGQKGLFEAEAQADGSLLVRFIGTVKTECSAFLVRRQWDVTHIAVLTSVGNRHLRLIPGHTALAIDGTVYSFEFPHFKVMSIKEYFAEPDNLQRAIVVQELDCSELDASAILNYLRVQVDSNIYFFCHKWCSYQATMALKHGYEKFKPEGINTPWEVYQTIQKLGMARRTYYIWDPVKTADVERGRQWEQLSGGGSFLQDTAWGHVYSGIPLASTGGPDVRSW